MKIAAGADHGGWQLKNHLVEVLRRLGHEVEDFGAGGPERVDYPDYAERVARAVAGGEVEAGLLVCGTGIGMSIAANKVPGIRAAVVSDPYSARMAKEHNHANVLCLGGRVVGEELARECLEAWLGATKQGERHQARVAKIDDLDAARGGAPASMVTTRPFIPPSVKPQGDKK